MMYGMLLTVDLMKKAKSTVHNLTKIIPKKNSWELSLGMVKTIPKKFCQIKKRGFFNPLSDYASSFTSSARMMYLIWSTSALIRDSFARAVSN